MFFASDMYTTVPSMFKADFQDRTYRMFDRPHIPFESTNTDRAVTIEDGIQIDDSKSRLYLDAKLIGQISAIGESVRSLTGGRQ